MKITIITCYDQNDYVRAQTLREAFGATPGVEMKIIRNHRTGLGRYPEVAAKIIKARLIDRPDVYVITFRGYEMLLFMVMTGVRRPLVFDEMVNFTEWMEEHQKLKQGTFAYRLFRSCYGWLARRSRVILADTAAHAQYSAALNHLPLDRYRTIPVGAEEKVFYPAVTSHQKKHEKFTVFYYGHMLPLHGLEFALEAAQRLKEHPDIEFYFVGGKDKAAAACAHARQAGAHVRHEPWLPYTQLADTARQAGLTLGGPFGGTNQAQYVITGKTFQFLAVGAPVVVGETAVESGFRDKVNCLLVPQANPAALAEAILWAADHQDRLHAIGKAGRALYEERYSQTVITALAGQVVHDITNA
jgi:glycosyltransferase involved in cell wall biosynthesis